MALRKIKSRKDLETIINDLENQGFGYIQTYKLHQNKINNIKSKANVLNVEEKDVDSVINNDETYNTIEKKVKKYFNKFKPEDKIKEYFRKFYVIPDIDIRTPDNFNPSRSEIINWIKFKRKIGIDKEFGGFKYISYYNLDKNFIKLRDYDNSYMYEFSRLYKLLYGTEPKDVEKPQTGIWYDLGEIEVKYFKNDTMNIKGNIKIIKDFFYKNIRQTNIIVKYNKKLKIY